MTRASVGRVDQTDLVHRILRFLAWFGIIYGVLSAIQLLMIRRRPIGRTVVIAWAVLFLVLTLVGAALYDVVYLYWVATKPRPEPQFAPVIAAIHLLSGMRSCAFAIISLYLLRQPEIAAGDVGIVKTPLLASATKPEPSGL